MLRNSFIEVELCSMPVVLASISLRVSFIMLSLPSM
nr:MAG TPA: hypothetical protein [Caudoviricetes sp.]